MRRPFFLIPLLCLAAAACQKELPARLEVIQDVLSVESPAGGTRLEFIATRSWTATTDVPWCRALPESGNGGVAAATGLTILCEENTSPAARSCKLTLSANGMVQTVVVTQQHKQGALVPTRDFDIGPDAMTLRIPVWKTTDYQAVVDDACKDWLHLVQTKAMTQDDLTVDVDENTFTAREGTIRIHCDGKEETIIIRQRCGIVKFDDAAFKSYCLRSYDTDYDGQLSVEEALAVTALNIPGNVVSVQGLEQFTNLQYLYSDGGADEIDIRKLPKLEELHVSNARSVLFSGHQALKEARILFWKGDSPITISDCPALERLELAYSDTPALTLWSCDALQELQISGLGKISTLSLDNLPGLNKCTVTDCGGLKSAHFTNLPRLETLDCVYNTVLSDIRFATCSALSVLELHDGHIHRLDLSTVSTITTFRCSNNPLKDLNLSGCTRLSTLMFTSTGMESLDFSAIPELAFLELYSSPFKELDFSGLQNLISAQVSGCDLVSLTARDNPRLEDLRCSENQLEHLEVRDCPRLTWLNAQNNQIRSIEGLTNLGSLQDFYCDANQLTALDISGLPRLAQLSCTINRLRSLDLTHNPALFLFMASNNPDLKDIYLLSDQEFAVFSYDEQTATLHYR